MVLICLFNSVPLPPNRPFYFHSLRNVFAQKTLRRQNGPCICLSFVLAFDHIQEVRRSFHFLTVTAPCDLLVRFFSFADFVATVLAQMVRFRLAVQPNLLVERRFFFFRGSVSEVRRGPRLLGKTLVPLSVDR